MDNLPPNAPVWPQPPAAAKAPARTHAKAPERMPTEVARRRARLLKRWTLAGAALTFCALSGLAASHLTGITAAAGLTGSSATATPSNQDDNGSFFPGDGEGSGDRHNTSPSGGFNFGSGGSFQPPASSSSGS